MDNYLRIALVASVATAVVTGGTIAYALMGNDWVSSSNDGDLVSFSTYEEFASFIDSTTGNHNYSLVPRSPSGALLDEMSDASDSYSTTNIQVSGVDEADIVKTNGQHIFVVSSNAVTIIRAQPADDMEATAVIEARDIMGFEPDDEILHVQGIYLWKDRLVVVSDVYEYQATFDYFDVIAYTIPVVNRHRAVISVFDVEDASSPKLEFSFGVSGRCLTSRMIDGTVYLVAQSRIYEIDSEPLLPRVWSQDDSAEFKVNKVYYDAETQYTDAYVNLMALDAAEGEHREMAVITGYASTVYMSMDSLYLTYQKWVGELRVVDDEMAPEVESTTRTTIHKIACDGLQMDAVATGDVRGWLLNQFSMDEKDGMLRVATTTSWSAPENNVYVLSSNLSEKGVLEGLAPTERIYAARFMGDTLYLVTFLQVDPLFVIDLSDPSSPKVVGELKIPGFSSYLHPVGDGYVLGIGSQDGHVKLSLFDVTDATNPVEKDTYIVEERSWTSVGYDHKAVLYDPVREILVIPVTAYDYSSTYYQISGAWVFNLSPEDGISLWGVIEHEDTEYYSRVTRSLYINDVLYTMSYTTLMAHSLLDLSEIGSLTYYTPEYRVLSG
ncbi:MAG: beta-propeller domain-containing protein [Methanobacteriota archaeon]|nr:MAG: beta-propeller domain-containing protein [Euryarchaeota archaeon]